MHRKIIMLFVAFLYYALAAVTLYNFDFGLIVTSIVLFGLPAFALAHYSSAPPAVVVSVMTFGAGIAILFEGIAHIYGIWYTIGVEEFRLFGLIPLEVIVTSTVQTLFLALLYELIFDDGQYSVSTARSRFISFGVFGIGALLLVALHEYVLKGVFFTHSYLWMLGILVASSLSILSVHKLLTLRFFDRLLAFSLFSYIPLLISLFLAVSNTHKVFAYTQDYLFTFTIFGNNVPIEELLLVAVLPLFVATMYELYLDDGK